jgi:hypothetical protein
MRKFVTQIRHLGTLESVVPRSHRIEPRDGVAKQEKALSEYRVYVAEHYASKNS